jgi:peptidoglycan/LPS O-acetylase OafA/YrhL
MGSVMLNIRQNFEAPGAFRLLLALTVFVHHATRFGIGSAAVYIFFILSGFWICTMWTQRYSRTRAPYVTYSISRVWRLLPVFALTSCITWGMLFLRGAIRPFTDTWSHQIISNLLMFGYNSLAFRANGAAWSLDIEMQFYLLAPLLIILITRSLPWALLACAIISVSAYLMDATRTVAPYIAFFAIGVASASSGWKPGPPLAWISLLSTLALILGCVTGPFKDVILGGAHPGPLHAFNPAACVLLGLMMAPWAVYTTSRRGTELDGMYGDLSFIVYLLHWPVLAAFSTGQGSYVHRSVAIGEAFIVIMVASLLIWRAFDHPINKLRSSWVARRLIPNVRNASVPGMSSCSAGEATRLRVTVP